jgi:hypothetical protein
MNWKAVDSSQISEVGYDEETSTLGIRFKSWKKGLPITEYHYANVSPELHSGLVNAISVGKFFGEHIKSQPDKYPFMKIEPETLPGIKGAIAGFMDDHGIDTIKAGSTVIKGS